MALLGGIAAAAASLALPRALAQDAKLMSYGRHLSGECTTCHRMDGADSGIPSIVGWPAEDLVATLKLYRDGQRTNPVMVSVASSLSDEQMQALAAYLASLPTARKAPAAGKKAAK
jgi:cytochrome c553